MRPAPRGQSPLVGVVLLLGLVAVGSIGLLVVAGQAIVDSEQQSEQERIEQSFVKLSHEMATAARSGGVTRSTELDAGDHGAIARTPTGQYSIVVEDEDGNRETVGGGTIGTIEYEGDDGTKIAYEAGGVFRETGEETQVVSPPPFEYDPDTDTLSFPLVTVTNEETLSSGKIVITHEDAVRSGETYVMDFRIFVEIESEYCWGWESYFERQAGHVSIVEGCADGDEGTVYVRLGYDEIEDAFADGVALPDGEADIGGKDNHNPFDDVVANAFPPLDETIERLVTADDDPDFEFEQRNDSPITGDVGPLYGKEADDEGWYYVAGIEDGHLEFDLSDGDAILVVDGDISTHTDDDGITVTDCGDGNDLRVYVTGDLDMSYGATIEPDCPENGSVETIQVYGTSEMGVNFGPGNPTFVGLLYAASSGEVDEWEGSHADEQILFQGNPTFNGSIVAESIHVESTVHNVEAAGLEDPDIEAIPAGFEPAPQITYLNVVNHEVTVRNR